MSQPKVAVLICGGAGYIGGSFALFLKRRRPEVEVVILDNLSTGHFQDPHLGRFYQGDIGDSALVSQIVREHAISVVFHFSAFLEVGESVKEPLKYYENNIARGIGLLKGLGAGGGTKLVFSSSAAVYGQPERIPIDEDHPVRPINPYGKTKAMFESILEDVAKANPSFKFVSLRYFNVAGTLSQDNCHGESHFPESHLIPRVLDVALGLRPVINVFGDDYDTPDGTCVRDYIDMEDLCEAHLLAMDHLRHQNTSEVINLGSEKGVSVKEIIQIASKVTGMELREEVSGRREGDPSRLVASHQKARAVLGWTPKVSIQETIDKAWKWHQVRDKKHKKARGFSLVELVAHFKAAFDPDGSFPWKSSNPFRLFFAPGRINLIGEHMDYNGGLVFPAAINHGTYFLVRFNNSQTIRARSMSYDTDFRVDLAKPVETVKEGDWRDFLRGCLLELGQLFPLDKGLDILVFSNMPISAGLSSSASFTVGALFLLIQMENPDYLANDPDRLTKIALIGHKVESGFIGVKCGIMDQFIIANAKDSHGLVLDCNRLVYDHVPVPSDEFVLLLCNTNVKRDLAQTEFFNQRVEECQQGLKILREKEHRVNLADYDSGDLEEVLGALADQKIRRRVRHVLSENQRVKKAVEVLRQKDFGSFGKLLNESGTSLKYDFEVTGKHLDWMVEAASKCEGVLGARMMGAGFGGCALVMAHKGTVEKIKEKIAAEYREKSGIEADFYEFRLGDGVREIKF